MIFPSRLCLLFSTVFIVSACGSSQRSPASSGLFSSCAPSKEDFRFLKKKLKKGDRFVFYTKGKKASQKIDRPYKRLALLEGISYNIRKAGIVFIDMNIGLGQSAKVSNGEVFTVESVKRVEEEKDYIVRTVKTSSYTYQIQSSSGKSFKMTCSRMHSAEMFEGEAFALVKNQGPCTYEHFHFEDFGRRSGHQRFELKDKMLPERACRQTKKEEGEEIPTVSQ